MRELTTIFSFIFFVIAAFAQNAEDLPKSNWALGKEKVFYGNSIARLEGKNKGEVTNIAFKTFEQLNEDVQGKAEEKGWTEDQTQMQLLGWEVMASGGVVQLFISRKNADASDLQNFTVVIKNLDEEEIFSKKLDAQAAQGTDAVGHWWNTALVVFPEATESDFYVYILEETKKGTQSFKFEVKLP